MADDITKVLEREAKWQRRWREANAFVPKNDGSKPRFYNLVEFPFLSGAGMHAGHMMNYSGMDVMARFRRARGYDVLFPMGFDAMGIAYERNGWLCSHLSSMEGWRQGGGTVGCATPRGGNQG